MSCHFSELGWSGHTLSWYSLTVQCALLLLILYPLWNVTSLHLTHACQISRFFMEVLLFRTLRIFQLRKKMSCQLWRWVSHKNLKAFWRGKNKHKIQPGSQALLLLWGKMNKPAVTGNWTEFQAWATCNSILPLSYNSWMTTLVIDPLCVLHRWYWMSQLYTWQPLSVW